VYAVIQTGGKQYKVAEGDILKVEKLEAEAGATVILDQVLMVKDDSGNVKVGQPVLADCKVTAAVLEQGRNKKIIVYKYKRRKNERKKQGHRQAFHQDQD
jgi:large subunit ribosomal protein L21